MERELENILGNGIITDISTFPAKLTGMNWSRNELTLELENVELSRNILYNLLKRIDRFDDIDFKVTLEHNK